MRFPFRLSVARCVTMSLLAAASLHAETPKPRAAVSGVVEKIYAPTDIAALRAKIGRRVVLEGKIVAMGSSRSGATSYLNFTKNYHDSVSLVFLAADGKGKFTKEQLSPFIGKKIHISGLLDERSGALQVRVFEIGQIKVLP